MGKLSDDILKWTLDVNGSPARKELTQVSNATNKLERDNTALGREMAKLEAHGKKGGTEWNKYKAQIEANNKTITANKNRMAELRKEVGLNNLSATELRKEMKSLKATMDRIDPNSAKWKELNSQYTAMQGRLTKIRGGMGKVNQVFGAFKKLAPWIGFGAAAAALKSMVSKAIQTRTEFSRYEAVLENTLGSQKAANKEFAMLKDFAATTPFQLNELTGSYVKLVNQGFKPTKDEMQSLGDLAGSMGKSFDQLAEAIIDAQVGENERLKEFGIRAQKHGDKISYTFKGVTTEVDNNAESIRKYILSLGDMQGVAGGMAKISETIGGAISNSADASDNLFNSIGKRLEPAMVKLLTRWTGLLNVAAKWVEIPTADKLKQEQLELNTLVHSIVSVNDNQRLRNDLISELQQNYPEFLANIDAENITNEELLLKLNDINKAYLERIRIAVNEEDIQKNEEKMQSVWKKQRELVKLINADYDRLVDNKKENATLDEKIAAIAKTSSTVQGYGSVTYASNAALANSYKDEFLKLQNKENKLTTEYNDLIKERSTLKTDEGGGTDPEIGTRKTIGIIIYEWNGKEWKKVGTVDDSKEAAKSLETANKQRILQLNEQYANEETLQKEFHARLIANELAYLQAKLNLETDEQARLDLQTQIVQKQQQYNQAIKDAIPEIINTSENVKNLNANLLEEGKLLGYMASKTSEATRNQDELSDKLMQQAQLYQETIGVISNNIFDLMSGSEDAFKSFAKNILIFALEQLKIQAELAAAGVTIQSLASPESVATFGAAGIAKAAIIVGLIEAAFAGVEGLVNKAFSGKGKKQGGFTYGDENEIVDYVHGGEWVSSAPLVQNPDVKQFIDVFEMAQRQGLSRNINTQAILASLGLGGKKSGGYANQSPIPQNPVPQMPIGAYPNIDNDKLDRIINKLENLEVKYSIEEFKQVEKSWKQQTENTGLQ